MGVANENKTKLHLQSGAAERRSLAPDGYTSQLWELDCCGWFLSMGLSGLQLPPFCIRGAAISFLKKPLVIKTITQRKTGSNSLYPSSYKPSYLSPTFYRTWCQKNWLERSQSVKTRNKKQEEKWTLNRKIGKGISWY